MRASGVALLILVGLPAMVRAEDRQRARELYRQGTQHYDVGDYKLALDSFKEAYHQFESPEILFNIAQCHRQLGEDVQAVREYRMYLLKASEAQNRSEVQALIAKLEKAIAEAQANKSAPPLPTVEPRPPLQQEASAPPSAPAPAPVVVVEPKATPVYKKWWLWTIVGVVVVGGVVTGAVVATRPSDSWSNIPDFGPAAGALAVGF
jgi:hypothetical protein